MTTATQNKTWNRFYIDGQWVEPHGKEKIEVIDPATGELIRQVPKGNESDVDDAVKAARAAFPQWMQTPLSERLDLLQKMYDGYQSRIDELTEIMRTEVGIPIKFARTFLTESSGEIIRSAIENARNYEFEYDHPNGSRIIREAYGVIAAISPWNNPIFLALNKISMALAAGCTVVHKPASNTPGAAFVLAELAADAGFPPGVFNIVCGSGSKVGDALARHPEVDVVDFTGSLATGQKIAQAAAENIAKVILELGGKSPIVVLDDADFKAAMETGIASAFLLSGQTCGAFTRILVPRNRLAEAEQMALEAAKQYKIGATDSEDTTVGPVASKSQQEKVLNYINQGIESGAKLLYGGASVPEGFENGAYVQPTIFSNVDNQSIIAQEEIFGPVQCLIPYEDEAEAVRLANETKYGLRGAVWGSKDRAVAVAKQIRAGQVDINGDKFNLEAPWGGYKGSGYGRCMGVVGLEEFLQMKSLQIRDDIGTSYS